MSKRKKCTCVGDESKPSVEDTALVEYLEAARHEYDCESEIKASFENRAGIVLALLGALCVAALDKVPPKDVLALWGKPMSFSALAQFLAGSLV